MHGKLTHSLGAGWTLETPDRDRGHWVVRGTCGRNGSEVTAALLFAVERGHCADADLTPIPPAVLARLDKLVDRLAEEGVERRDLRDLAAEDAAAWNATGRSA